MPLWTKTLLIGVVAAVVGLAAANAEQTVDTKAGKVRVTAVVRGIEHPWGLAFLPDGRFLVTERNAGHLRIGTADGGLSSPVEGVPDVFRFEGPTGQSQGGLLHVAVHPDFERNRLVYLSFSEPSERGAGTAIARGALIEEGPEARLDNVEVIFSANIHDSGGLHFGGRFVIHPETRKIYLSIGDRRNMSRAQDPKDHAGSIVRMNDDGSLPDDNPFVNDPEKDDMIFSWGHRNIHGLAFRPGTTELWANEHGAKGGDEINLIQAGKNYGWPFQSGGPDYSGAPIGKDPRHVEGMEPPIHIFERTVAPSGLAFYTGSLFPQWNGQMLHGGLTARALIRTRIDGGKVVEEEWMLGALDRRIRDVQVHRDGSVWLLTEHEDGEVLRLTPEEPGTTGSGEPQGR